MAALKMARAGGGKEGGRKAARAGGGKEGKCFVSYRNVSGMNEER